MDLKHKYFKEGSDLDRKIVWEVQAGAGSTVKLEQSGADIVGGTAY